MGHVRGNGVQCNGVPYLEAHTMRHVCKVCKEQVKAPAPKKPNKAIVADDNTVAAALKRRIDPNYKEQENPYKDGIVADSASVNNLLAEKARQRAEEAAAKAGSPPPAPAIIPAHGCVGGCSPFNYDFNEDKTQATCGKCGTVYTPSNPPVIPSVAHVAPAIPPEHRMSEEEVQMRLRSRIGEKGLPEPAEAAVSQLTDIMSEAADEGTRTAEPQTAVRSGRRR